MDDQPAVDYVKQPKLPAAERRPCFDGGGICALVVILVLIAVGAVLGFVVGRIL